MWARLRVKGTTCSVCVQKIPPPAARVPSPCDSTALQDEADPRDCPGAIFVSADARLESEARSCAAARHIRGLRYRVQYAWQALPH